MATSVMDHVLPSGNPTWQWKILENAEPGSRWVFVDVLLKKNTNKWIDKGKSTGNPIFQCISWENLWFPVNFPLKPIQQWPNATFSATKISPRCYLALQCQSLRESPAQGNRLHRHKGMGKQACEKSSGNFNRKSPASMLWPWAMASSLLFVKSPEC